jgi:hypothetical protein
MSSLSTTPVRRPSAKSSVMVASGPMNRSTELCEISRSCHSATFSIAGTTALRTMRARPVRFSVSTGLRLCGIAELPFCPGEKYSSASSTSVRCKWRTSTASRSIEEAITPRVAKNIACRSRGMTWVETVHLRPSFAATWALDARIDVGEGADRAGNRAGGNVARAAIRRALQRENSA